MSQDFAGLTAVVTGAGSGIGLEVVKGLKAQGANVFGLDIQEGAMNGYAF
jgi:NAD(P)-dependent dehydrogenase (short-subunit alcohol dehydrogenase family)